MANNGINTYYLIIMTVPALYVFEALKHINYQLGMIWDSLRYPWLSDKELDVDTGRRIPIRELTRNTETHIK